MKVFEQLESEVRGYCRSWPTVFSRAEGCVLVDEGGKHYLDFFAGAGALNYGHNHPALIEPLVEHLKSHGIIHGLDMATTTKRTFLETFDAVVLQPRDLDYKLQFPGPTGTNAVEAALKLARKVTGRQQVVSFTNGFHGMTLGSLAVTGNELKRRGGGVPLPHTSWMPFDGFLGDDVDTLTYIEAFLEDGGSGVDLPAAIILETVQAEGGVNVASDAWLEGLQRLCSERGVLLIVDDIQVGCGRTGRFFSWEHLDVRPDIVCLSKSLSGSGLPMALTLMKPEHDVWDPGEHNGTFRGNNAAFVTATAALEQFWTDDKLSDAVATHAATLRTGLEDLIARHPVHLAGWRGRGLLQGVQTTVPTLAAAVSAEAFRRGLVIETAGMQSDVIKLLPPLVVSNTQILHALDVLETSLEAAVAAGAADIATDELDDLEVLAR